MVHDCYCLLMEKGGSRGRGQGRGRGRGDMAPSSISGPFAAGPAGMEKRSLRRNYSQNKAEGRTSWTYRLLCNDRKSSH
jgi:hypothetical protein